MVRSTLERGTLLIRSIVDLVWSSVASSLRARTAGKVSSMDMVVGSIAVIVWIVLMVPAAFVFMGGSESNAVDSLSSSAGTPDNLTQLPRSEARTEEKRLAA